MRYAAAALHCRDEFLKRPITSQFALLDRVVDAGQVLLYHAASTDVGVADLGVAHLMRRQSDEAFARLHMRVRKAGHEAVPVRRFSLQDSVVVALRALTPAVENAQHDRAWSVRRRHVGYIKERRRER